MSFVAFPYFQGLAMPLFHLFGMDEAYKRVYAGQDGLLVILTANQVFDRRCYCLKK